MWGRTVKVFQSVYRFPQVPGWACAAIESTDMWCLSGALSWSLCPLSWSPDSGVLKLSCRLAAGCEGVITECEVRDALRQIGLNKSPGRDSLPYEVITSLKKGGKHVWESVDDYWPITLLNTELKVLVRVLANRLQLFISYLIGLEHTYAVREYRSRTICTWFAMSYRG